MITFRIDDIGASSKYYNQRGKNIFRYGKLPFFYFPFSNFWFFKRIPPFKRWGPYEELTPEEWTSFLELFKENGIVPLIAITACWVDEKNNLIPFYQKFPQEALVLKQSLERNEIEIANHGLTHCVVGRHLPKLFSANRQMHREFWPELPAETHEEHILKSQKILEDYFGRSVGIFVPPGNVWGQKTYEALRKTNIQKVIADRYMLDSNQPMENIQFIHDRDSFFVFHDRELKLYGKRWLNEKIKEYK